MEKAQGIVADEIVLDLEDSVAPSEKSAALDAVRNALANWTGPPTAVRVNRPGTPWCHHELIALAEMRRPPRSVVVPKVETAADLAFVDRLLDGVQAARPDATPLRLQALIESAAGLAAIHEIAAASPRLEALIIGYADLAVSLGRPPSGPRNPDLWLASQDAVLVAARAHNLQAIDGPFLSTIDDEPFRYACARARDLGFDGKWAIHPSQVGALNELFTPSDTEIAHARLVIETLAVSEAEGSGAAALHGEMLDDAVRRAALRVLSRAGASA